MRDLSIFWETDNDLISSLLKWFCLGVNKLFDFLVEAGADENVVDIVSYSVFWKGHLKHIYLFIAVHNIGFIILLDAYKQCLLMINKDILFPKQGFLPRYSLSQTGFPSLIFSFPNRAPSFIFSFPNRVSFLDILFSKQGFLPWYSLS